MNSKIILVGALTGIAVGAIIGVLFAPNKGTETRKQIAQKSFDTAGDLKDKFGFLLSNVTAELKNMDKEPIHLFGKVRSKIEEFKTTPYTLSMSFQIPIKNILKIR